MFWVWSGGEERRIEDESGRGEEEELMKMMLGVEKNLGVEKKINFFFSCFYYLIELILLI